MTYKLLIKIDKKTKIPDVCKRDLFTTGDRDKLLVMLVAHKLMVAKGEECRCYLGDV